MPGANVRKRLKRQDFAGTGVAPLVAGCDGIGHPLTGLSGGCGPRKCATIAWRWRMPEPDLFGVSFPGVPQDVIDEFLKVYLAKYPSSL
jgi:hypothetical protein